MDSSSVPADIDRYFEDRVGPIWRQLRGGLWHSTGSHRLASILDSGALLPEPKLSPGDFKWAVAGTTLCRSNDGVSLFDFQNADWPWLFHEEKASEWEVFLRAPTPQIPPDIWTSTVWLGFNRTNLPEALGLRETRDLWDKNLSAKWMPRLEVCHRGPLSLSACTKAIVVCAVDPRSFEVLTPADLNLERLEQIEAPWKDQFSEAYRNRGRPAPEQMTALLKGLRSDGAENVSKALAHEKEAASSLWRKIREAKRRVSRSIEPTDDD